MVERKEKTVITYVCADHQEYGNQKDADAHEKLLELGRDIEKYKVDGPSSLPGTPDMLLSSNFQWYKAKDEEELREIMSYIRRISGKGFEISILTDRAVFPELIGYDGNHGKITLLSVELRRIKAEVKDWNEFLNAFDMQTSKEMSIESVHIISLPKRYSFEEKVPCNGF